MDIEGNFQKEGGSPQEGFEKNKDLGGLVRSENQLSEDEQMLIVKKQGELGDAYRMLLAERNDLTPQVMLLLSNDKIDSIRKDMAMKNGLPETAQFYLAKDENVDVRRFLAENPSISDKVKAELLNDDSVLVREDLLNSINSEDYPQSVGFGERGINGSSTTKLEQELDELMEINEDSYYENKDLGELVRLENSLSEVDQIAILLDKSELGDANRMLLAERDDLTPFVMGKLSQDRDNSIRKTMAMKKNLPRTAQFYLVEDKDVDVRRFLAENPNIHNRVKAILLKDNDSLVRDGVLKQLKFLE